MEMNGRRPGGQPGHLRYGGRKKGTPNRATVERAQILARAYADEQLTDADLASITPLEAMLLVMRRRLAAGDDPGVMAAAVAAAPYCHAKLISTELRVRNEYIKLSDQELQAQIAEERRLIAQQMAAATGRPLLIELELEPADTPASPA
jgi:hypothetical protein